MTEQVLERRLTHKYVGSCQHLDKWEEVGTVQELTRDNRPMGDDICEPYLTKVMVRVQSLKPDDLVRQALRDTYTKAGCAHEWDCCGCRSYHVHTVQRVDTNVFCVEIHSSRNF